MCSFTVSQVVYVCRPFVDHVKNMHGPRVWMCVKCPLSAGRARTLYAISPYVAHVLGFTAAFFEPFGRTRALVFMIPLLAQPSGQALDDRRYCLKRARGQRYFAFKHRT